MLKQRQYQPLAVADQLAELIAVTEGLLDDVDTDHIAGLLPRLHEAVGTDEDLVERIESGEPLSEDAHRRLRDLLAQLVG